MAYLVAWNSGDGGDGGDGRLNKRTWETDVRDSKFEEVLAEWQEAKASGGARQAGELESAEEEGGGFVDIGMQATLEAVQGGADVAATAAAAAAAVQAAGGTEGDAMAAAGTAAAFAAAVRGLSPQEAGRAAAAATSAVGGTSLDMASAAGAAASSVTAAQGGSSAEASNQATQAQSHAAEEERPHKRAKSISCATAQEACKNPRVHTFAELARLPLETEDEEVWLR